MAGSGYHGIEPIGGTGDRGRDAVFRSGSDDHRIVFAFTVRTDWRVKLNGDCARIAEERYHPTQVVFVCTSTLSGDQKDGVRKDIADRYGWPLEIYDLERIRVLLTGPLRNLVAHHPSIFCPPWFAQKGGIPIRGAADTVLIDHVVEDHALAIWLARRLELLGYRTWCHGIAPLAGENADDSARLLVENRAIQYLPVLSVHSLADSGFMERCGGASSRDGFLIPCWAQHLGAELGTGRLARLNPARFDLSWSKGISQIAASLISKGVPLRQEPEIGHAFALRAYMQEPITKSESEKIFANVFRVVVPSSIFVYQLSRALTDDEEQRLRSRWAFAKGADNHLFSFDRRPAGYQIFAKNARQDLYEQFSWEDGKKRHGKDAFHVVKELVRRSLEVRCADQGLSWCPDRHVYFFGDSKYERQPFQHVDGRDTWVALNGERQYGWGERASKFRYQLAPKFSVGQDAAGVWWTTVRIYVRVADLSGKVFEKMDVVRRRKAVTKMWWNKEWLARLLGVIQALRNDDSNIAVGTAPNAVIVSTVPLTWDCPIAIDMAAIDRIADLQEEMAQLQEVDEDQDAGAEEESLDV